MEKIKKSILALNSFFLHLIVGGIVLYFWRPMVFWYWQHRPILGVDFYNTATYVSYILRNFSFRMNGWKYIWYAGNVLENDYPTAYFYLIAPLAKIFGLVRGIELAMLIALGLFLLFAYLSFWEISKSKVLSGVLTLGTAYSIGVYGALTWGGSLPYFVSQTFFSACLYLIIRYLVTSNKRYLAAASLVTAFSIFGHPQVALTFIFPMVLILLLFWQKAGRPFFSKQKIFDFSLFSVITFAIVGPRIAYENAGPNPVNQLKFIFKFLAGFVGKLPFIKFLSSAHFIPQAQAAVGNIFQGASVTEQWRLSQINHFVDWTNPVFFYLLAVGLVLFLIGLIIKRKRDPLRPLPFLLLAGYSLFYVVIYGFGIDFFHGGWYRIFWSVPLVLGLLIASFWPVAVGPMEVKLSKAKSVVKTSLIVILNLCLIAISGWVFWHYNPTLLQNFEKEGSELIHASSGFPSVVNMTLGKNELESLRKDLVPEWIDPFSKDYRLLEADAQVNIWWNSLFDLPLAKGYIDPPNGGDWFYWLNAAVFAGSSGVSQLVDNWHVPPEVALNDALYLLDWYGIKYLEANHASDVSPIISQQLLTPSFVKRDGEVYSSSQKQLLDLKTTEKSLDSPILAVNYPHLLFIGSGGEYDKTVEAILRQNHGQFMPVTYGPILDSVVGKVNLNDFSTIFISQYTYQRVGEKKDEYSQLWQVLADYVSNGGNLLIIPINGRDANTRNNINLFVAPGVEPTLPEPFPISRAISNKINSGEVVGSDHLLAKGVDFSQVIIDQKGGEVSIPTAELRSGANVIASYQGNPFVVERNYGQGKVIWSGVDFLNSPGELSQPAALLLKNIFDFFNPNQPTVPSFSVESENLGKEVLVKGDNSQGVLIKGLGNAWDWEAVLDSSQTQLEIFSLHTGKDALVYVRLPKGREGKEFSIKLTSKVVQNLHYYELKDELVSPILSINNSPVVGVVSRLSDYETVIRSFGLTNMNSHLIIPLYLGQRLDQIKLSEISKLDALVLYGYDYRSQDRAWGTLADYVKSGGRVFIETGNEVKQTDSINLPFPFPKDLPEIFPIEQTSKGKLGEWNLSTSGTSLTENVDLSQFGPPLLDNQPWVFSLPAQKNNYRTGAEILLQTNQTPLIVSWDYGQGKVIWSGMNLFYHSILYNNLEEGELIKNLISDLTGVSATQSLDFSAKRISAKKAIIQGSGVKGVLFKERFASGWQAKINSQKGSARLKIYPTGPSLPGLMYVLVPSWAQNTQFKVTFFYQGTLGGYFYWFLSLLAFLLVADYTFFGGNLLIKRTVGSRKRFRKYLGQWWEKDED